jgi:hypothetical protein
MVVLAIVRYDTVSDYLSHVKWFFEVLNGNKIDRELGYYIFCRLFSFSQWGFIFVFAVYTIIAYAGIYSMLKRYNIMFWGTAVFLFLGFINMFDNIIRQAVAMGLFAYSLKYITVKSKMEIVKYFLFNSLGILFHTSAVITFAYFPLLIFLRNIKIHWAFGVALVFLSYAGFRYNVLGMGINLVKYFTPVKYNPYVSTLFDFFTVEDTVGLGNLFISLLTCFLLFIYSKTSEEEIRFIINVSFCASLLGLLLSSVWVIERLAYYLYIPRIVGIALALKYLFARERMPLFFCVAACLFLFHFRSVKNYYGYHNKYYTVFSERRQEHMFYKRIEHHWNKLISERTDFTDRTRIVRIRP